MSEQAKAVGPEALPALREQVERIVAEAKRQGATGCEVAVSLEQGLSTSVRQREVETVEFNRDQGFGITLYVGQRKGSASTSATGDEAIRETVAAALAIARHTSEDDCAGLADPALMARDLPDLDLYHAWSLTPDQAVERTRARENEPSPRECTAERTQRRHRGEEVAETERPQGEHLGGSAHGHDVSRSGAIRSSRTSQPGGRVSAKATASATSPGSLSGASSAGRYCSSRPSKKDVRMPPGTSSVTPTLPAVSAVSARVNPTTPNLLAE